MGISSIMPKLQRSPLGFLGAITTIDVQLSPAEKICVSQADRMFSMVCTILMLSLDLQLSKDDREVQVNALIYAMGPEAKHVFSYLMHEKRINRMITTQFSTKLTNMLCLNVTLYMSVHVCCGIGSHSLPSLSLVIPVPSAMLSWTFFKAQVISHPPAIPQEVTC